MKIIAMAASSALALMTSAGGAAAGTILLDGVYSPGSDAYGLQYGLTVAAVVEGTGAIVEFESKMLVGFGDNAETAEVEDDLFLYVEVPVVLKDMTWGNGTSPLWKRAQAFDSAVGSEFFSFDLFGAQIYTQIILQDLGGTEVGHLVTNDPAAAVVEARTSLDYIINNYANDSLNPAGTPLWGTGANSPEIAAGTNHTAALSMFDDYPFKQSFELQIRREYLTENGVTDLSQLQANIDTFLLHASPPNGDYEDDLQVTCFETICVETYLDEPPPAVPLPAALPLMLTGLAVFGALRLARRRA